MRMRKRRRRRKRSMNKQKCLNLICPPGPQGKTVSAFTQIQKQINWLIVGFRAKEAEYTVSANWSLLVGLHRWASARKEWERHTCQSTSSDQQLETHSFHRLDHPFIDSFTRISILSCVYSFIHSHLLLDWIDPESSTTKTLNKKRTRRKKERTNV